MNPVRASIVTAAVLAAALAAGATGVALADNTSTPKPTGSATASEPKEKKAPGLRGMGKGRHLGMGKGMGMLAGRGALHGEFVVKDADGDFRTMVVQRGEATAVSADEITVRSEDGFTTKYAVTADTLVNATRGGIKDIEKGAEVNVVATKTGSKATALKVGDQSAHKQMRERFGLDESGTGA